MNVYVVAMICLYSAISSQASHDKNTLPADTLSYKKSDLPEKEKRINLNLSFSVLFAEGGEFGIPGVDYKIGVKIWKINFKTGVTWHIVLGSIVGEVSLEDVIKTKHISINPTLNLGLHHYIEGRGRKSSAGVELFFAKRKLYAKIMLNKFEDTDDHFSTFREPNYWTELGIGYRF